MGQTPWDRGSTKVTLPDYGLGIGNDLHRASNIGFNWILTTINWLTIGRKTNFTDSMQVVPDTYYGHP